MKDTLEKKQQAIKAQFDQLAEQIVQLQDKQKNLQGAFAVLDELIKEAEAPEEK